MNSNKSPLKIVVLVSGRGSNMQALIEAQSTYSSYTICGVISDQPKAPALDKAQAAKIPTQVIQPLVGEKREAYGQRLIEGIEHFQPGCVVLAGFMRLLGKNVIEQYAGRLINIHPSLLPAFPGLNAQKQAIEQRATVSGCTVHFVDEGCDTGPIILQTSVDVQPSDTIDTLSERILREEHKLLPKAVDLIAQNKVKLDSNTVTISWG